ncbi:MAG: sulfatase-like hydrolase/transferase [Polyangiaceae bacterium]
MRIVDALLCVAGLLLAEWLVVGLASLAELVGPHEWLLSLGSLLPLGWLAAAPIAVVAGLSLRLLEAPVGDVKGRGLLAGLAALFGAAVGWGVSGGRLLAGSGRPIFVLVVAALGAGITWAVVPPIRRRLAEGRLSRLAALGLALAALAVELTNRFVLPRLYPAFHLGLAALACGLAAAVSLRIHPGTKRSTRLAVLGGFTAFALPLGITAPDRLRLQDNLRFVFEERAPLLGEALRLASRFRPPPPIAPEESSGPASPAGPGIDLGSRDILLITVDALRADHVGAYGQPRPLTPAIDALAERGVVFEAAYTATPHTSYALTSLMTGKYMRPLLLQGVGDDSVTWADALRTYGYRTAAFYPPAAFFVDRPRFTAFEERGFGFEYRKVQFSSAPERVAEVKAYLTEEAGPGPLFLWVHLFEPHEPYERHPEHDFGDRSIDRYDSEVRAADDAIGELVATMRAARPRALVIVTADHGEEFGDHGGRYHGTTVYDEQVRVPLVMAAEGLLERRRVGVPVSLVDLMPTVLAGLKIPISPRIRGRDLGGWLRGSGEGQPGEGFAFSETEAQTLLAEGDHRLICARRVGACRLFSSRQDPGQTRDVSAEDAEAFARLKRHTASFVASLGRYEEAGATWPQALRRGIAGDIEAALDVAALLDDAKVEVRRKAAEVLFELRREEVAPHLRRALRRDEDDDVRRWAALALTRLEQGAPLTFDLLADDDVHWRRLAALALAEAGDDRGENELLRWWRRAYPKHPEDRQEEIPFERAKEIAAAFGRIRSEAAVIPLGFALRDVRLRRYVAEAMAAIGEEAARPALAEALADEQYQDARVTMARALVALGGEVELRKPLIRFLGVPDPLEDGVALAEKADILQYVGGPRRRELRRLREFATSGVTIGLVVPKSEHARGKGLRVVVRARAQDGIPGELRVGLAGVIMSDGDRSQLVPKRAPTFDESRTVTLAVPPSESPRELYATLPTAVSDRIEPGDHGDFVVYATQNVEVLALVVVPLAEEVPPPPPEPWTPGD